MAASPNLAALPTELIQEIARQLLQDNSQLAALRLASRQLHAKTQHTFLCAHFASRRHLLTEASLAGLVGLAQQPALAAAVRALELSLLPFEQQRDRNAMHDPTSPFHVAPAQRRAALTRFLDAQARARRAAKDVELLAAALRALPNLHVLRVRYDPRGCWGWTRLGHELGWPEYMAYDAQQLPQRAGARLLLPGTYGFEAVLAAVAASGAAVRELEVEGGLPPSALALPDEGVVERLRAPLAHLRVLTLFVSLPLRTVVIGSQEPVRGGGGGAGAGGSTDVRRYVDSNNFLSLLPNLEVLRLGAARGRTSNLDRFLAEVFLSDSDDDLASPGSWPRQLKALHLLHLDCRRGEVLDRILHRCEALEYLVLEDGAVRESCWRSAMRYAAVGNGHPNLVGVLCKRFEVLPDDGDGSGWALDEERSPFLEYGDAPDSPAKHLVVDREGEWPRQQLPWRVFTAPEFWGKERVLFQMR